jgi:hypothetical protein
MSDLFGGDKTPVWKTPPVTVRAPADVAAPKPRRKGIAPASAKGKGRKLQQDVRDAILAAFTVLEPDDVRSTSMGAGGEDVQLSPAARRVFPFTVECKQRAEHAVYTFMDQAAAHGMKERAAGKLGYEPLVVVRADRRKALAVIDLDFFMEMARAYHNYIGGRSI